MKNNLTRTAASAAFVLAVVGDPMQALAVCAALWMFERLDAKS